MASDVNWARKSKIVIFHPSLAPYRVDFFNALNRAFNASFYFNFQNVVDQKFNQNKLKANCNFTSHYLINGFDVFGYSFRSGIIPIMKKEHPEIVLTSEYSPITICLFIYKIFNKKKFRLYTMSDDSIENSKSRKGFRAFVRNTVSKNINGVIFPSQAVCEWYRENISVKTKTFELPIIHEDEKFRNLLVESLNTANKNIWDFGLKDKRIILFVGRLVEVKNLSFLINVVSQIKSTDWVLVMVGDGFLMNDLKAQAVISGISDRTYFVGRKEGVELVCWYTIAQIFVLPSTYERYGAVVNEALLAGCRVLCSELAGASVLINENNGELFNPYNENEFLNCIVDSLGKSIMTHGKITKIRESQMPFTFNEKVEKLLSAL